MCATPARHRAQRKDTPDCEREFWAARDLVESAGQGRSARHTRKVQSWYAPHIGRVGALAVSLGVGLAIANTAGVAYADTDSESVSSRTESDDDSPSAGPRKSSATAGSEPNEETSSDDESPDEDADDVDEDITEDITEDEEVPDGDAEVEDPGDEGQSPDEEVDPEEAVAPETEPPSGGVSDLPVDSDDAPQAPPLTEPTPTRDVDAIVGTDAESPVDSGDEASDLQIEGDAPTDDGGPQTEMVSLETSTTDDSVALAPAASPTEVGVENVNIVSALVAGVISPFADPAAPAQVPWFDALMAWVRRQITHTFFNKSPVIGPITTSQIVTGQLLIDLSASDPNGDPLTYTIIQPENGLVIRDPITGTFIYTPTTIVTEPVTDTFQVIVSDDSEHLKGIAGLIQGVFHCVFRAIGLAEPDKVTVTIPVTIDPLVQLPPVVVTVGAPIYALGSDPVQLLSSVVITDVDSTNLSSATVTIATGAQDGDVLEYVAPESNPIVGEWDAETKTLTLTGPGTLAEYREALKAVSFFTTDAGIPRGVLIRVTDDTDVTSPVPGVATIAVIGFPPLVVVSPVALGSAGSPVTVSPVVVITDLDSEELDSATVTLTDPAAGDLFGWGDVPAGVTAGYAGGVLTFTGSASVAEYRDLLASVTLTSSSAGVKLVNFAVVDGAGNASVVPAATVVTVVGLAVEVPPLVIVSPAAAGTTGSPIAVSPIVVVTDLDSEELDSATVTLAGAGAGVDDVFGWGTLPTNVAATVTGGVLTFTGTASVAEYRDLLASVTLTSASAGLKLVSFAVVDGDGNASVVPAATVVTVVGLAVEVPPLVIVSPVAAGAAGSPVTVSPVVLITDLDSEELDSATVTLTDPGGGDSFGWGDVPAGVTAGLVGGVLTFTGTASRSDYQALLESVTLTSSTAGLKLVSFAVVDGDGNASVVPAATVVTVVGLAVEVPPLVIVSPVAAGAAGSPVTVSPIVVITDLDSTELDSATVTLTDPGAGDSFGWGTLPTNVAATVASGVLTFTGSASVAEYRDLLASVTLTSSAAGVKLVSFAVVDGDGNASVVPAATVVTVVGLAVEVPPLVIVSPAAAGTTGSPIAVSPIVVVTDLDSEELDSATVTLAGAGGGDSFGWGSLPTNVAATVTGGVLTFTGTATRSEYQALLESVTLTSSTAGLKLVSFAVVDGDGNASVVPAATVVTVVGLAVEVPPLVIVSPVAAGAAGSPVTVSPVVVITDLDSTELDSATVTLTDPGVGDSFGWGDVPAGVTAGYAGGVLTFTGSASVAEYRDLLASVTLTSSTAGLKLVSFAVVDGDGNASVVPAATVVTVVGLAVEVPPLVIVSPAAAGAAVSPVTVSPVVLITDLDSTELDSATVTLSSPGVGDSFGWGSLPTNVAATVTGGVLTFTGTASVAEYRDLLASVTLTSSTAGLKVVSFAVVDGDGNASTVPAATVVTVVGLAVEVPPLVIVSPAAAGAAGSPVTVSPVVVITDLDSTELDSATVTLTDPGVGDSFGWGDVPAGVTAGYAGGVLTFTGSASVAEYRDLLASVTLTSSTAGLKLVSFAVVDGDGNASVVPAATVVTVVGLAVEVPPLVIVSPAAAGAAGSPVTVSPVVLITDLDSTELDSATVTLSSPGVGDSFGWGSLPTNVAATVTGGVLTFTGTASVAEYRDLLASVTLTSSTAGLKVVSFAVVDGDGNASTVPAATVVTVVGLAVEVPPLVIVSPAAAGAAGSPVAVSPVVVITDLDSTELDSATVTLSSPGVGDSFGWGALPTNVAATVTGGVLTFTGTASVSDYQALLESVTLTSSSAGLKLVSFTVVDGDGNASTVPAATVVTVVGLAVEVPPLVIVSPAAAGVIGSPVTVSPVVVITDLDSEELASATVTLTDPGVGDSFGWGDVPAGVTAALVGGVLTFTGTATRSEYQALLESVTLTSATAGLKSVTFAVVDGDGNASVVPAATVVTVVGLAIEVPPLVIVSPAAAGTTGSPITLSPVVLITDLDSEELDSATVTLADPGVGDSFGWGDVPAGVTAGLVGGVLTFTGTATRSDYQALLESVTLTSSTVGLKSVTFAVVDGDGNASVVPAATVVTVVGLAVEVPPLVIVSPAAAGATGSPVTVSPVVVITDLDSSQLDSATVTLSSPGVGDSFGWGTLPGTVAANVSGGVLTFTGTASVADYQALLESVTLTSATAGLKSVTFTVIDGDGNESVVPAVTAVTVVGVPGASVAPVLVATPIAAGTTGSPITVSPVVVITDLDSALLESATVTLSGAGVDDVFDWGSLPTNVAATVTGGVVSFTGTASVAEYRDLLASVTLTSATAGIKSVTFTVTDGDGNTSVVPAVTAVTVVGVPGASVAPVLVATPIAAGTTGSPITVSPVVVITDLDSSQLDSATVTLSSPGVGDSFGWGSLPTNVAATVTGGVVSFTGTASVAEYRDLLASVTLTSATAGLKSVTFAVTDGDGNTSVVPAVTAVTVVGVPGASVAPVLVATPIAAGTTGSPITVSPVVVITDLDSALLESATVTLSGAGVDDVFGWGTLPGTVAANVSGGVVSFTGAASVAEYRDLLASVTLTSATAGIKSVTFTVTDGDGNTSVVPAVTAVTVVGVPGASVAPVLVATPIAAGTTGSPITVSPIVVITDLDSSQLDSATVTLSSPGVGDSFGWGTLPGTVAANVSGGVLSFTGTASVAEYRDLLASVTLTSATAGIKSVTFTVTDSDGNTSVVPAVTAVTVVGVPGASVAPVLVATPIAAGTTGSAITVSPIVVITDLDSSQLDSATVTLSNPGVGDSFGWGTLPGTVAANVSGGVLTFTGTASVAEYRDLLASVTLTSATAGIKSVTFTVTDSDGNTSVVPAITAVTVVGVPGASVAPVLVATPIAAGTTGSPITVSPIVVITDLDSSQLDSATVTLSSPGVGDSFGWGTLPTNVAATVTGGVVSFTGSASVADYQALLESVTLTSATAGLKSVTFTVTDSDGNESVVPAVTAVTVVGVPGASVAPVLVATPIAAGTTGSPITVSPVVVITDLDSALLESATVTLSGAGVDDVFGWGTLPGTVAANVSGGVVSFTGAASVAEYRDLLASVTLTSATAGIKSVTFTVTDSDGNTSVVPAVTAVTVVGVPGASVAPVLVATPIAAGTTGSAITVSPIVVITDLDSSQLDSATVTLSSPGVGDSFGWGTLPGTVAANVSGGVLTFTGTASVAEYRDLLASVTLTSATAGIKSVTFTVTDGDGNTSVVPAVTAVTVVGVPGASVAPVLVATPIAAGTTGSPITVSPIVVITDLDSSQLDSATVTLSSPGVGDSFGWGTLPGTVAANVSGGVLSFTGAASVAEYRDLLASVTLTSATAGIKSVTFTVTDSDGNTSVVPAITAVTVVGVPGASVAPVLVATPIAAGTTGSPITVSPVVVITDLDSALLESATVTLSGAGVDDVFGWGTLPGTVAANVSGGVVSFTGAASVAEYRDLLASVTLTSATAGIKSVTFTVTDGDGNTSVVPAVTAVTVVGVPGASVAPVLVATPIAAGTTGSAITVSPIVVITDLDSSQLDSATVTLSSPGVGDSFGWGTLPGTVAANVSGGVLTFTGTASVAEYRDLLASVTLTSATAGIKSVTFTVTDSDGNTSVVPAVTAVTVVGLPVSVAPIVLTSVVNVSYTAGTSGVAIDPGVIILDGDSTTMTGATVTIIDPQLGDTLVYGPLPTDVTADFDSGVLTFEGTASVSDYQQLLRSVTFSTNSSALATIKTISFTITDDQQGVSAPGLVTVTVLSLPILATPAVVTSVVNVAYTAGDSAIVVDPGLILLDADSTTMSGAVVAIVGGAAAGESLGYTPQAGINGSYNAGVLTFDGVASVAAYQQLLRSVTFSTDSNALATIKSISLVVTDDQDKVSAPALVAVTVVTLPLQIAPLVTTSVVNVSYTAGNSAITVDPLVSVLDLDSTSLEGATVEITGGFAAGDVLSFTAPTGITGAYNSADGVLTLEGTASIALYEQALRSVTLSTGSGAIASLKTVSFSVVDAEGTPSLLPANVVVTVVAAPVNLAPLVVTTALGPIYTAGNTAVDVNPLLTVLDLDSATLTGASVAITGNFASGDLLAFTAVAGISGSYDAATGILTFTGSGTPAQYQQLLRSVTFSTNGTAPAAVKTVTFTVTDPQGATSLPAAALVTVTANSAPILTAPLGGGLVLLGAQVLSSTAVILDDSSYLDRAVVTITNVQSGDSLTFTPTGSITGAYSAGVLTLTGLGTVLEYQTVIQSIRFSKSVLNLLGFRNITMVVRDAQGLNSNTTSGTMTLVL